MKVSAKNNPKIVLELEVDEAEWLKSYLQNWMSKTEESVEAFKHRRQMFTTLEWQLYAVQAGNHENTHYSGEPYPEAYYDGK